MKILPPAIIEVTRGECVESVHQVTIVVADVSGNLVQAFGDAKAETFPRSAIKSLQALPLIESGAADAYDFEPHHLALACASHNGADGHVSAAREMLTRAGLPETCLECGAQLPRWPEDQARLVEQGIQPTAIHNNCSGKHSGFAAFAHHQGWETKGYININHPVQREIAGVLEEVTGAPHGADNHGLDGCSIPTYTLPLDRLACGYAKFGVGEGNGPARSAAMLRLRDACLAHPEMVAGNKRVCTQLMQALGSRAFVKVGAEGVYTASLPELGFGIAMKAHDGNFRAVEVAVATMISRLLKLDEIESRALAPLINPVLTNWNGFEVGRMRMVTA